MTRYKFGEVLNDGMDYLILGDPDNLLRYKQDNKLPDNLLLEFTTRETGDEVVEQGIMVPIRGVDNQPYTIYFTLPGNAPELLKEGSHLQVRQDGYCLQVKSGRVYLYTMPYLREFTAAAVDNLKKARTATMLLPEGWYAVSVLGGQTVQQTELVDRDGRKKMYTGLEPTFEFLITPAGDKPVYSADVNYSFSLRSNG